MKAGQVAIEAGIGTAPSGFKIVGTGDFNGDGTTDILFQNPTTGVVAEWEMKAGQLAIEAGIGAAPSGFKIVGTGDFNHDATTDVLFQNSTTLAGWEMNAGHIGWLLG
jgi:FG-GAP-like repeat